LEHQDYVVGATEGISAVGCGVDRAVQAVLVDDFLHVGAHILDLGHGGAHERVLKAVERGRGEHVVHQRLAKHDAPRPDKRDFSFFHGISLYFWTTAKPFQLSS
jgi:hypothetical protein